MSTPSVDIIASWPTPDYDNPHEPLDTIIYAVNIPLMVLMTVFVGARFISRTFLVRNALGIDDWMMLIAFVRMDSDVFVCSSVNPLKVLAMAMSACQLVEPRYGIGRHLYDVKYAWYPSLGKVGRSHSVRSMSQ